MDKPYFLHFVNEVDFVAIEDHDKPILERYAAAADFHHEGKHGLAVRELQGDKATVRDIQEHIKSWGEMLSETGTQEVLRAFLEPGAEKRFPVPFQLQLLEEEMAASRYLRDTHDLLLFPVTIPLVYLKFLPTTKFGPLAGLLEGARTVPQAYSAFLGHFREKQEALRRTTLAIASGTRLSERVVLEAHGSLSLRLLTDGQEHEAHWVTAATLAEAAVYDLWDTLQAGIPIKACELSTCRRIFIPKDHRQRFHASACWRRSHKQE